MNNSLVVARLYQHLNGSVPGWIRYEDAVIPLISLVCLHFCLEDAGNLLAIVEWVGAPPKYFHGRAVSMPRERERERKRSRKGPYSEEKALQKWLDNNQKVSVYTREREGGGVASLPPLPPPQSPVPPLMRSPF
jgi:hypothetical protein